MSGPVHKWKHGNARALAGAVVLYAAIARAGTLAHVQTAQSGKDDFSLTVEPVLRKYCSDCHADGVSKGNVSFDTFASASERDADKELWWKALKNLRAGMMPPAGKPRPASEEKGRIEQWIKSAVLQANPADPDPGRVTLRRLNRVEYRNTIRDLMGIDFDTSLQFPPDDTGHGFDNIGDVLTLSPMLLEKYLDAARLIVNRTVPVVSGIPKETIFGGSSFLREGAKDQAEGEGALRLSYYSPAKYHRDLKVDLTGKYQLSLNLAAEERFVDDKFDYNKCRIKFLVDGKSVLEKDFNREDGRSFRFNFPMEFESGTHKLSLELEPLTPGEKQVRSLKVRIDSVRLRGPMDPAQYATPKNYEKFFPRKPPANEADRELLRREILARFCRQAFRRPADAATIQRLADLARSGGETFEAGIGNAIVGALVSSRFLFRAEALESGGSSSRYPRIDEYSLASRLSYFLWSSMPDARLMELAEKHQLRAQLPAEVERMLKDWRAEAFPRNFVGQWLQARDIETVVIDSRMVLEREQKPDPEREKARARMRELRAKHNESLTSEEREEMEAIRSRFFKNPRSPRQELSDELRRAMREETEKCFEYVMKEDRPVTELIEADYTFLNQPLARFYGMTNVNGPEMRLVKLPAGNVRGGILGQGTVLAVTSNPTRTSPVKRGLFILDNILGMPTPPPPPNIPPLEAAAGGAHGKQMSLRETLLLHRQDPKCSSCHNRMDPIGLAMENFNAMGMWRDSEQDQPIEAAGKLLTGESFTNVVELKSILARGHRLDFYRCFAEKMLIYALGRGLTYEDVETVDEIVDRLQRNQGKFSAALTGIIESNAFQRARNASTITASKSGGVEKNLTKDL